MTEYESFISQKIKSAKPVGFDCETLNPALFDWQSSIVKWSLRRGRAALFEDCGLGKTIQQLAWGDAVCQRINAPALLLTPLAVGIQTLAEADRFNVHARIVETQEQVGAEINITNYQKLHHFSPDEFGAIIIDESSVLKSFGGETRKALNNFSANIHFRLACTATPAPNDLIEIINHAEYLGIMSGKEIILIEEAA